MPASGISGHASGSGFPEGAAHRHAMLPSQYTYTTKIGPGSYLDPDRKPRKTEVNVFEVFPRSPERVGYQRQIVKNGKPLTGAELEKSDRDTAKKIDAVQRKLNDRSPAEREKLRGGAASGRKKKCWTMFFGGYEAKLIGGREDGGWPFGHHCSIHRLALVTNQKQDKEKPCSTSRETHGSARTIIRSRAWKWK